MPRVVQANGVKPAANGEKPKKKRSKPDEGDDSGLFSTYLPKLAKQCFPDGKTSLSGTSAKVLSSFLGSVEETLTNDSKRMAAFQKKKSINAVSVQVAVHTRVPRELAKICTADGSEAVSKFEEHVEKAAKEKRQKKA